MWLNKILQKYYQMNLLLDVKVLVSSDDPFRFLSTFMEKIKLSDMYQDYGKIKKNRAGIKRKRYCGNSVHRTKKKESIKKVPFFLKRISIFKFSFRTVSLRKLFPPL